VPVAGRVDAAGLPCGVSAAGRSAAGGCRAVRTRANETPES